ncbi:ankyrin repeat-containing domain protein [Tirmania nivea]|nr:ankyrin repeat-containing domain protein [Tirmania nivea]
MDLGYSVGDIMAVSRLAWHVYNVYKDAPDDFRNISGEIKSLHIIIDSHNLKAKFQDPKMTSDEREGLREILEAPLQNSNSIASFAASINSKEAWKQFLRDFHKGGVTADMICEKKDQILEFFQGLTLPVAVEEALSLKPQTENSASRKGSDGPSKGANKGKQKRNQTPEIYQTPCKAYTGPELIAAAKSGDDDATALFGAAGKGHSELVNLVWEEGANIEAAINTGGTPLYIAAQNGHLQVVWLLLGKGANIEAARNSEATALLIAAHNQHLRVVKLLLEKGANIEAADSAGATALYVAAQNGRSDVVGLLLEKGARIEAAIRTRATALHIAAYNGYTEVVRLLLEKDANTEADQGIEATALYIAAQEGHFEAVGYYWRRVQR